MSLKIGNLFRHTVAQFFREPKVRREVCAIAASCSSSGVEGTVTSVNNVEPGAGGNVTLTPADIGAGTSNLELGTTSTTAKPGDYQPTWTQVTSKPTTFAPSAHNQAFTTITGVATAAQIPSLAISKITGLQAGLDGKVAKVGDRMTGPLDIIDGANQSKIVLGKFDTGSGHNNAPTSFDKTSIYLHLGALEYNTNSYRLIGFGYRRSSDQSHTAAVVGYQETNSSTDDCGRLLFATRPTATDVAPTVRLTIEPTGEIEAKSGAKFVGDGSGLTNLPQGVAVPQTATQAAAETPTKAEFDALLAELRALEASLQGGNLIA